MSGFDPTFDPKPVLVRRVEVITGVGGGRRRWSPDAKAEIVMEAIAPGAVVSEVARRHDLRPQQLFGWLREARQAAVPAPVFAPVVVVDAANPTPRDSGDKPKPRRRRRSREGGIELEIDGVVMRVGRGAEAKTVAAVIQALKAGR